MTLTVCKDQTINSQKTFTLPAWATYGMSFVSISYINYHIIRRLNCIYVLHSLSISHPWEIPVVISLPILTVYLGHNHWLMVLTQGDGFHLYYCCPLSSISGCKFTLGNKRCATVWGLQKFCLKFRVNIIFVINNLNLKVISANLFLIHFYLSHK